MQRVVYLPDGKTIVSASADKTLRLWDVTAGQEIRKLEIGKEFTWEISPDGKVLAFGLPDHSGVELWELASGKQIRVLPWEPIGGVADVEPGSKKTPKSVQLPTAARCLAFSLDGEMVAAGGFDNTVRLWEVATGKEVGRIFGSSAPVTSVAFCPNDKYFYRPPVQINKCKLVTGDTASIAIAHDSCIVVFSPIAISWPWRITRR